VGLVVSMLAIAAVLGLCDYLSTRLIASAGQRVVLDIRCLLFRHLEAQSLGFHQKRKTGDLLARLGGDIQAIQSALVTAVPVLLRNALTLVGMVTIMALIDLRYTLLAVCLVPFLYFVSRRYLDRIKAVQRTARRADGEASSVAQEVLTSITVVQAFGTEDVEAERYARATGRGLEANRQAIVAQSEFTPIMTFAMTASTVLVVLFGARAVISGHLTPGYLLIFMAYLRGMYSPVRQLAKLAGVVGRAQAAAERVAEILETSEEVPEHPNPRRLAVARGSLELAGVSYSYAGGPSILDGIDLEVPPGSTLALVGATGSGKSTLLRLVPRFFDPTSGRVLLDGTDVAELAVADLRRQVALVPQEPYLFAATVWENITYGSASPSAAMAVAAAKAAGVHEVVCSFPDGYDTAVAERGSSLSGGQRQCVALARAMARDAPLLLLDEPTVGLDAELESVLVAALERLSCGRTTIMVTHQLWGLRRADRIAVLSEGRIAESGTHDELVGARRTFFRLKELQRPAPSRPTPSPELVGSVPTKGAS